MGIIINDKDHYFTRLPLLVVFILLLGFSPVLFGAAATWINELTTGIPCNEGNCKWMTLSWLTLVTLPLSVILLIVLCVVVIFDSNQLRKGDKIDSQT